MEFKLVCPFYLFFLIACDDPETECLASIDNCQNLEFETESSLIPRKVLIIGIDGFRAEAMQKETTPFLWQQSQCSETFYTNQHIVEYITISGPNWSSILTGVHWCKHNVTDNKFINNKLDTYPNIFQYIEQSESTLNTVSIVGWSPINKYIAGIYADFTPMRSFNDTTVYLLAKDALLNKSPISPDLMFLHFGELDKAGHSYGFGSHIPEYNKVLSRLDFFISELISIIEDKRLNSENWLVLILSDHGGFGKEHINGRFNNSINQTIFYVNSPDVDFIENYISSQVDIVPTILDFMDFKDQRFYCFTDGISIIK